ncbi:hypothetical protein LEL_08602 [Akanthomyces lecanii RCEF 1005]|uniref:Uncharacterized protein n=1 Tax=Akanthomyces lecanii RCEF 1005 TaxID=1081108 RepID=A0A168DNE9_CORDF|nr:hypothetical protein LEL_08602 [Akanthomyces lecanii RCEF 1005]
MPRRDSLLFLTLFAATFFYFAALVQWRAAPAQQLPSWRHTTAGLASTNLSVHLVLATLKADDISWTSKLDIPNLRVIRYVSDDPAAQYRPPVPRKGREALIYHTYFYDFYDDLPDLSIMIHAEERPWHMEGVLQQSMAFALSQLDLERARQRGYANLRVSWENACPAWLDTTKTPEDSEKQEEPYMREAFEANFGPPLEVPRILAGPCCSQFVVTKEAVRRHPRSQYQRSRDWLVETGWSDYIAGRTWEHMFPWLFRGEAVDCPGEAEAYCSMYGICFERAEAAARYNRLWQEKRDLMEATEVLREILDPQAGVKARARMAEIDAILREGIVDALKRGQDEVRRSAAFDNLFKS